MTLRTKGGVRNDTQTYANGNFSVGSIEGDAGDFEILFEKNEDSLIILLLQVRIWL